MAVRNRRVLNRKGRLAVRVRIVGGASLGWLEAAELWGACVEAIVTRGGNINHLCNEIYSDVLIASPSIGLAMSSMRGQWDGVLMCTVFSDQEAEDL